MPDDREAQAGPSQRPGPRPVHAEEAFEDPRKRFGRNAGSRIGDRQDDFAILFHGADDDRSAFLRVFHRIVHQVGQGPLHELRVPARRSVRFEL